MPSSETSWPISSAVRVMRAPSTMSMPRHTSHEAEKTNAPMANTPMSWVRKLPPEAMQTAKVPQTPAKRCAGMAPTTSSSLMVSKSLMPAVQTTPPTAPMRMAQ